MGIGRFWLSDKTSTQTDNATGGQTEVLGNTGPPTKPGILKKSLQCLKDTFFKSHWKNVWQNQTLIIALYLTKILSQCTWKIRNWFSINQSISEWVSWICQRPWCKSFILIASIKNSARRQISCSQTLTVFAMNRNRRFFQRYFSWRTRKIWHFKFLTKPSFRHSNRNQQEGSKDV